MSTYSEALRPMLTPPDERIDRVVLITAAVACVSAGVGVTIGGPVGALVAAAAVATAALATRPFVVLCCVLGLVAVEALTTLQEGSVATLSASKLMAIPLAVWFIGTVARDPKTLPRCIGTFFIACFLALTLASWMRADRLDLAVRDTLTYIQLAVLWIAVRMLVDTKRRLRIVAMVIAGTMVFSGLVAISEYVTRPDLRVTGTSQNAALLSADLTAAVAFALALAASAPVLWERGAWFMAAAVSAAAIPCTLSRSAFLAAAPAMLAAGFMTRRPLRFALAVAVAAVVALQPGGIVRERMNETNVRDISTLGHLRSIRAGLAVTADNPLLGVGVGNYPLHFLRYTNDPPGVPRTAHNSYLAIASESGVPALAAFLGLHLAAAMLLIRGARTLEEPRDREKLFMAGAVAASLTAFAFIGLFQTLQMSKFLWVLLGLATSPLVWRPNGENAIPLHGARS